MAGLSVRELTCRKIIFFSEFEPIDTQKGDYIETELFNRFDEQLVNTTRLRKTGPHTMKSHIKKIIRPELKYLVLYCFVFVSNHCFSNWQCVLHVRFLNLDFLKGKWFIYIHVHVQFEFEPHHEKTCIYE